MRAFSVKHVQKRNNLIPLGRGIGAEAPPGSATTAPESLCLMRLLHCFLGRHFAGDKPCTDCYMVHNNIIMGYELKRYRFKEHSMWSVDNDG